MQPRSFEVVGDADALAARAADVFARAVEESVSDKGSCAFALSRPTPERVFQAVGRMRLPRRVTQMYQVDERVAPDRSDDRNLTLIERDLASWVRDSNLHKMKIDSEHPENGGKRYAKDLEEELGSPPILDFVHLGLGTDGHTASLMPGDPVLDVRDKWVATTKKVAGFRRLTLTYPVIDAARLVIFVVSGREKAEALRRVLSGDKDAPAARIQASNVRFFVDAEAAAQL
jgi:6-phosphogluconolactonase